MTSSISHPVVTTIVWFSFRDLGQFVCILPFAILHGIVDACTLRFSECDALLTLLGERWIADNFVLLDSSAIPQLDVKKHSVMPSWTCLYSRGSGTALDGLRRLGNDSGIVAGLTVAPSDYVCTLEWIMGALGTFQITRSPGARCTADCPKVGNACRT